jgi:hypothetical protein
MIDSTGKDSPKNAYVRRKQKMTSSAVLVNVSCAVEVFLATALLHKEQPDRPDFTIQEIVNRAARENITGEMRSGVSVHASQHCVANKPPNPAKHRMLFATGKHTRRLLLPGDEVHPERTGKIFPDPGEVPENYLPLLEWVRLRYESRKAGAEHRTKGGSLSQLPEPKSPDRWLESLFELEGLGKEHWRGVDPDEFVRQLREGWE